MTAKHLKPMTDKNGVRTHRWVNDTERTGDPRLESVTPAVRKGPVAPETAFHVTSAQSVDSILRDGLRASRGPRSEQMEDDERVFVFNSRISAEDAVGSWLGDQFDDEEQLILLSIDARGLDLEPSFDDDESFEWSSQQSIAASRVSVVSDSNL